VPPGGLERLAGYPFLLWEVVFGGFLLHAAEPVRALFRQPSSATAEETPQWSGARQGPTIPTAPRCREN
jgi:hypothetical protein